MTTRRVRYSHTARSLWMLDTLCTFARRLGMSLVWRQANRSISLMGILALGFDDLHGPTTHTFGSLRYRRSVCVVYEGHTNRKKTYKKRNKNILYKKETKNKQTFKKRYLQEKTHKKIHQNKNILFTTKKHRKKKLSYTYNIIILRNQRPL